MRTYLVVVDDSEEARVALRFAARRAAKTGGAIEILTTVAKPEFALFGGVQATMEEEATLRAEALVASAAGEIVEEAGIKPAITVREGDPVSVVRKLLAERDDIAALVLGAAADGVTGPLIAHFAGAEAGQLSCPVMIVPGSLSSDAIDRLS
ncbi:MAG TPA: universal stress protein [Sphingomonadaceae bacterium]|nr:universal stress protein [Sphingomonadaceae bacterium]